MKTFQNLDDLWARVIEHFPIDRDRSEELLRPICAALRDLGLNEVTVWYSGHGDDGSADKVVFEPGGLEVPDDLTEILETWVVATLPRGWDSGGGGRGSATIDVAHSRAHFDHERILIETEREEFEIG